MATDQDIAAAIQRVNELWGNPPARKGRFGNVLKSVSVSNVRQMTVALEFTWPLTAIGGVNGSGKSTVLQICSSAYSKEKGGRHYKIGDWIRGALPGETPAIGNNATISYTFWDDTLGYEVPHTPARRRWKYPSRAKAPLRHVVFIGIASFAPRIERRDRTHLFKTRLEIKSTDVIDGKIVQSISRILGTTYDEGMVHTVGSPKGDWTDTLPQIKRASSTYTEPHMGAGEQKVVRLVRVLEEVPEKSLILLEEPEITLHPDAQRGLAWYLMTLSARRGHQIIVATHSSEIFDVLPKEARVLLLRNAAGVEALHKVPYLRAARELSRTVNTNKQLILVEDEVAKSFLREILRRFAVDILRNCAIVPVGNTDDVCRITRSFRAQGIRAVGIRDADIGANELERLLSLPGSEAPESLLLQPENISVCETILSGIGTAFERARATGIGLTGSDWSKKVFEALPSELETTREDVADRLTLAWLQGHESEARGFVESLRRLFDAE